MAAMYREKALLWLLCPKTCPAHSGIKRGTDGQVLCRSVTDERGTRKPVALLVKSQLGVPRP